ncbi:ATP-dependent nuclease [Thalassospira xiamenensis]|uniref:Putative ATP-dependent endonuclease of the OLD family n=1 Tax=Thalassospira xiamenensis TaxID=220697 RepID=A0A285RMY7_9PROT|nr:AAA family ATPase [Thalassospira xiamenensis]SOB95254.1 putative ATP-dependent endonuclease of the OLD family [Thalassospira xiamenensis]
MHRLSKIKVSNFRSIREAEFVLSEFTPLVGNNNVGKSNILKAISWFLKKYSLQNFDFFDEKLPVEVEAEITGINAEVLANIEDNHRKRIEPHIRDGKLILRRIQEVPSCKVSDLNLDVLIIDEKNGEEWARNPTGIEAAISRLLPEPIFIGAMENAAEDVAKFSNTSTIGKLLREVIAPISDRYSHEVMEALSDVGGKLSSNGENKDATLVQFDELIASELTPLFPGIIAKTHVPVPSFTDFFKGATLKLSETADQDGSERDVASFGHGAQRSVQIALVKCLARSRMGGGGHDGRTTRILVDEPELYLHPQAVEAIRAAFEKLAGDQYQLVFSTHSPAMIKRENAANALLVRCTSERGTFHLPRIAEAVSAAIEGADHQADILFSLGNASKILFTDKVVLAEGKTERVLLPEIFHYEIGQTLEETRTSLVVVDSVDSVVKTRKILLEMGIPVLAIVDLDFAFRGAVSNGLIAKDNEHLNLCLSTLEKLAGDSILTLDKEGLPQTRDGVTAAKGFEILSHENAGAVCEIHNFLKDNHNIWVWPMGAIEQHLGLTSKKANSHRVFLDQARINGFLDGLPGYGSVREAMSWIVERP